MVNLSPRREKEGKESHRAGQNSRRNPKGESRANQGQVKDFLKRLMREEPALYLEEHAPRSMATPAIFYSRRFFGGPLASPRP